MTTEASREAFEADFSSRYPFQLQRTEGNGGDYSSPFASVAWQSWQAAEARGMERAALICDDLAGPPSDIPDGMVTGAHDDVRAGCEACAAAIREAI